MPDSPDEMQVLSESQYLLRQGRDAAAADLLEKLLENYPRSTKALRALAAIRMFQKRSQDAMLLLQRVMNVTCERSIPDEGRFSNSFSHDDAEFIAQDDRQQSSKRIYDVFSERAPVEDIFLPVVGPEESGNEYLSELFIPQDQDIDLGSSLDIDDEPTDPSEPIDTIEVIEEDEWEAPDLVVPIDDDAIWEGAALDQEDYELPTQQDFAEIPDRLTRAERALQVALKLGEEFDWDKEGIRLLATIFDQYWWSSAQTAMRREMAAGMTPQELELAEEVRKIWYQRPEFGSVATWREGIVYRNLQISWPSALTLIRSFSGFPDPEEIEVILSNCYTRWQYTYDLQKYYPDFLSYVLARINDKDSLPEQSGWIILDDYHTDDDDMDNDIHLSMQLDHYGVHVDPQARNGPIFISLESSKLPSWYKRIGAGNNTTDHRDDYWSPD